MPGGPISALECWSINEFCDSYTPPTGMNNHFLRFTRNTEILVG